MHAATTSTSRAPQPARQLTDQVVPAVRGEFYGYETRFSTTRPLFALMKCRANKDRTPSFAAHYAHEVDLTIIFEPIVRACSPSAAPSVELLADIVNRDALNQTLIAPTGLSLESFNQIRQKKNGDTLAQIARTLTSSAGADIMPLKTGTVYAVTTKSGKYGLFHVTEVTPTTVAITACHILL